MSESSSSFRPRDRQAGLPTNLTDCDPIDLDRWNQYVDTTLMYTSDKYRDFGDADGKLRRLYPEIKLLVPFNLTGKKKSFRLVFKDFRDANDFMWSQSKDVVRRVPSAREWRKGKIIPCKIHVRNTATGVGIKTNWWRDNFPHFKKITNMAPGEVLLQYDCAQEWIQDFAKAKNVRHGQVRPTVVFLRDVRVEEGKGESEEESEGFSGRSDSPEYDRRFRNRRVGRGLTPDKSSRRESDRRSRSAKEDEDKDEERYWRKRLEEEKRRKKRENGRESELGSRSSSEDEEETSARKSKSLASLASAAAAVVISARAPTLDSGMRSTSPASACSAANNRSSSPASSVINGIVINSSDLQLDLKRWNHYVDTTLIYTTDKYTDFNEADRKLRLLYPSIRLVLQTVPASRTRQKETLSLKLVFRSVHAADEFMRVPPLTGDVRRLPPAREWRQSRVIPCMIHVRNVPPGNGINSSWWTDNFPNFKHVSLVLPGEVVLEYDSALKWILDFAKANYDLPKFCLCAVFLREDVMCAMKIESKEKGRTKRGKELKRARKSRGRSHSPRRSPHRRYRSSSENEDYYRQKRPREDKQEDISSRESKSSTAVATSESKSESTMSIASSSTTGMNPEGSPAVKKKRISSDSSVEVLENEPVAEVIPKKETIKEEDVDLNALSRFIASEVELAPGQSKYHVTTLAVNTLMGQGILFRAWVSQYRVLKEQNRLEDLCTLLMQILRSSEEFVKEFGNVSVFEVSIAFIKFFGLRAEKK